VLKAETVAMMGQNHIGDLNVTKLPTAMPPFSNDVGLYPEQDKKWGLSFLINTKRTAEGRSPGSLAWAGLANTYFWLDPARKIGGVILMACHLPTKRLSHCSPRSNAASTKASTEPRQQPEPSQRAADGASISGTKTPSAAGTRS
jgi:CubicO group peptidase (beta-lactamase class C family)